MTSLCHEVSLNGTRISEVRLGIFRSEKCLRIGYGETFICRGYGSRIISIVGEVKRKFLPAACKLCEPG